MIIYRHVLEGAGTALLYTWAGLCVVLDSVNATVEDWCGFIRRALGEP